MIITKNQLRRIIKEEIQKELLKEVDDPVTAAWIVKHIIALLAGSGLGAVVGWGSIKLVDWLGAMGIGPMKDIYDRREEMEQAALEHEEKINNLLGMSKEEFMAELHGIGRVVNRKLEDKNVEVWPLQSDDDALNMSLVGAYKHLRRPKPKDDDEDWNE